MSRFYWVLGGALGLIATAWTVSAQPTPLGTAPLPNLPPPPAMMGPPPPGRPPYPAAMAWPPGEGIPRPPLPPQPPEWPSFAEACVDSLAHRAAARAYLKARLDLTPQQLPMWQELEAVAAESDTEERQACTKLSATPSEPSLLQRLDTAEERTARQLAHLRKIRDPLRKLTATLSIEQQKLIDRSMPPLPF